MDAAHQRLHSAAAAFVGGTLKDLEHVLVLVCVCVQGATSIVAADNSASCASMVPVMAKAITNARTIRISSSLTVISP